jgi:hypothetical protein
MKVIPPWLHISLSIVPYIINAYMKCCEKETLQNYQGFCSNPTINGKGLGSQGAVARVYNGKASRPSNGFELVKRPCRILTAALSQNQDPKTPPASYECLANSRDTHATLGAKNIIEGSCLKDGPLQGVRGSISRSRSVGMHEHACATSMMASFGATCSCSPVHSQCQIWSRNGRSSCCTAPLSLLLVWPGGRMVHEKHRSRDA